MKCHPLVLIFVAAIGSACFADGPAAPTAPAKPAAPAMPAAPAKPMAAVTKPAAPAMPAAAAKPAAASPASAKASASAAVPPFDPTWVFNTTKKTLHTATCKIAAAKKYPLATQADYDKAKSGAPHYTFDKCIKGSK